MILGDVHNCTQFRLLTGGFFVDFPAMGFHVWVTNAGNEGHETLGNEDAAGWMITMLGRPSRRLYVMW